MKHLGDISKIDGREIEPVDVITFGSPCQDLSVAGKRAGLKHEVNGDEQTTRSGLFMEAVRIIKEMRDSTNDKYPRFALWENVPGAFSSNKGEDFRIVLEELIKIIEPDAVMPAVPKKGWAYADHYSGDGWSIAYRVLDTQYWPRTPQRRRRIYLVADFGGQCAGEILFEREGLRGNFAKSGASWEGSATYAERSPGADGREGAIGLDGYNATTTGEVSATLGVNCGMSTGRNGVIYSVATQQGGAEISENGICPTITAAAGMSGNNQPWICNPVSKIFNLNKYDVQSKAILDPSGIAPSLYAGECRGGGGECYVLDKTVAYSFDSLASNSMKSMNPHSGCRQVEIAKTLDTTFPNPSKNQGGIAIVEQQSVYCLQGNGIDRADTAGCNGKGWKEDTSYTLNTIDRPAVAYLANGESMTGTICSGSAQRGFSGSQEIFNGGYHIVEEHKTPAHYIVRRLTPTECARLQGFPDHWGHPHKKEELTEEEFLFWAEVRNTHAAINGKATKDYTEAQMLTWYNKLHTDSAEYKMWGNGIALPCALYVMQGIADALGV